jgi:hypothetical protein
MSHYSQNFKISGKFSFHLKHNVLNNMSHTQASQINWSLFHFYFIM